MKITVNEAMVLAKAIRGRLGELSSLRQQVAVKETYFVNQGQNKVIEPQYDFKLLDKKCTELENFLFLLDTRIKQSNAITTIEVDTDINSLLAPLS